MLFLVVKEACCFKMEECVKTFACEYAQVWAPDNTKNKRLEDDRKYSSFCLSNKIRGQYHLLTEQVGRDPQSV